MNQKLSNLSLKTEQIRTFDVFMMYETGIKGFINRIREYGIGSAFSVLPTSIGVVSEQGCTRIVIELCDTVKLHGYDDIKGRITGHYRVNRLTLTSVATDIVSKCFGLLVNGDFYKDLTKVIIGNKAAVMLYMLTTDVILYPRSFSDLDMGIDDVVNQSFEFKELENG